MLATPGQIHNKTVPDQAEVILLVHTSGCTLELTLNAVARSLALTLRLRCQQTCIVMLVRCCIHAVDDVVDPATLGSGDADTALSRASSRVSSSASDEP